jgi:hypothetical protein
MGLFLRRSPQPPPVRLTPLDAETLKHLRAHATDLGQPRHVLHYSYFPHRENAQRAADDAEATGWFATVREPLPESSEWRMRAERPDVVLTDDVVRDSTVFFNALARTHGGEYDGWEAAAD